MTSSPLDGLLVIDLSRDVAAAYCCALLAAAGAEVVMVEPPGDNGLRLRGPFLEGVPTPENSALHQYVNAGKKSVTLDGARMEGQRLLRALIDRADAVVEDSSPGLSYDDLARTNPRLVLTSVSAYGSWGPRAARRLDNLTLLAAAGRLASKADCRSGEALTGHAAEYEVGLNAFAATIAGLLGVAASERGQRIEVAAVECLAAATLAGGVVGVAGAAAVPLIDIEHPLAGRLSYPAPPLGLEEVEWREPAPLLGQHNEEVYRGLLGLSGDEMAALAAEAVI